MEPERIARPKTPPVHWPVPAHETTTAAAEALPASGSALPDPVRERMQAAYGRDFSDVRIHTGAEADVSARAVGAQAYTVGHDVVFAADRFAPHTAEGERLLTHELGHVAEQRTGGHRLARQPVGERVAVPQEGQRDYVTDAIRFLRDSAEFYGMQGPVGVVDRRIGPLVRVELATVPRLLTNWLRMRTDAATMITTHLAGDASLTTQLRAAYRDAVRGLITSASSAVQRGQAGDSGRPSADDLYLRHQQLIHEWGWPEAELDPHRNDLLDAVPDAERARIRVDTSELTISGLSNVFGPTAQIAPLRQDTTITLGPGIPAGRRSALDNPARFMVTGDRPMLGVNRSTTVRLDLRAQGGARGTYRITQVQHPAAPGRPAAREVLVEYLAAVGPDRDHTQVQPDGPELFARHGFVQDPSWTDQAEFARLLGALATIPEAMFTGLDGIRFRRVATLPDHAAEYHAEDHSITVADSAFPPGGSIRAYEGPRQAAGGFDQLIAHEIAHAIDLAALRGPLATANRTAAARNAFLDRHGQRMRGGQFRIPAAQEAAWQQVRQTDDVAQDALRAGRAESGARFGRGGRLTDTLPRGEDSGFRAAARQDGGARITAYSDRNWREYFAESFSLYVTDPEGLNRLRPHVYQYFALQHPDPERQP